MRCNVKLHDCNLAPIFASEEAETTFQVLKAHIDRRRENYIHGLWTARQLGSAVRLNLESADAQAFFNYENAIAKLALLADLIASRNGRGQGIDETKRAAVISDCDAMIADAKEKLKALGV